jgi:predicted phage tail protein
VQYGDNKASIERVDNVMADASKAVSESLKTLDSSAGGNTANVTDFAKTMADFSQASATQINSLKVTVNGQQAAIVQNAQVSADINNNLNAMYSIKVAVDSNGNQYAAGMGIGVQNTPSGMQTQVLFLADRFAVMTQAGGAVTLPFVIQNGQTIIRDTVIGDGTIGNAKIGSYIQSSTWDGTGNVGWHINKSGFATFNNVTIRGTVYATNGEFTGKITATSGTFKGTVQAESFIGDVAVGQTFGDMEGDNITRNMTYTDSGDPSGQKHVTVMALVKVQISANQASAGVTQTYATATITIGDSSRVIIINTPANTDRNKPTYVTVMHSTRVTGKVVNCSIKMQSANTTNRADVGIYSPTMQVSRGSGSFTQS